MTAQVRRRLISVDEASARYATSRQTIYRMVGRGELRLIKIGRSSRLDIAQVDQAFGLQDDYATAESHVLR
jgi:excisionase family DNA binding protein